MDIHLNVEVLTPEMVTAEATWLRRTVLHETPDKQQEREADVRAKHAEYAVARAVRKVPRAEYVKAAEGDAVLAAANHIYADAIAWSFQSPEPVMHAMQEVSEMWQHVVAELPCDSEDAAGGKLDVLLHRLNSFKEEYEFPDDVLAIIAQLREWRATKNPVAPAVAAAIEGVEALMQHAYETRLEGAE